MLQPTAALIHQERPARPDRTAERPPSLFLIRNSRRLSRIFTFFGFDPLRFFRNMAGLPGFFLDIVRYKRKSSRPYFAINPLDIFPILDEGRKSAGMVGGHYFHQDLWSARKIFERRPATHLDVGSRMDGFIAHLLAFMPVTVIDIRAMESDLAGLTFIQDDATRMASIADDSIESLSSLHAAEHFGLGRYSDAIDPDACFDFMRSLARVLCRHGRLYFSVPVGRERVDFNAHRVFAVSTIVETFSRLSLLSFSLVDDAGRIHEKLDPASLPETEYACGLFEFTKLL